MTAKARLRWREGMCLVLSGAVLLAGPVPPAGGEPLEEAPATPGIPEAVAPPAPIPPPAPTATNETRVQDLLQRLNQIDEEQLSDKTDPGFSILRELYDLDGPDFLTVRRLLGRADIRAAINPGARCVLANVVGQRWDTFTLAGGLYLAGLKSRNPDLRLRARKKLVGFIQPAHIPVLIAMLQETGPNVLAYEVLQEVTAQRLGPDAKAWRAWWEKAKNKIDLVGYLLKDTKERLIQKPLPGFDHERLWYAPKEVRNVRTPPEKRSEREQTAVTSWEEWVHADVTPHVEILADAKPVLDRITHQPDPRVNKFLEMLTVDPGYGDYVSLVLAWRGNSASLAAITEAFKAKPTVGRALARGSMGDKTALVDLLRILERHRDDPLSYTLMNDETRRLLPTLRSTGVIPAEQAFELLCHQSFDFDAAVTAKEKRKAFKRAESWLKKNAPRLSLDRRRGYYVSGS